MEPAVLTLRQLQFFVSLAERGTFSAAAEASGVTQPSLSSAIQELERSLSATLVERGARACRLTPAGEVTLARARRVLADVAELAAAAQGAARPLGGPLRLGVIPTVAPFLMPRAGAPLRARFAGLKLYLREDLTERLIDGLRGGWLDLAVIALPYEASGVESAVAFAEEFLLLAPPEHRLAGAARLAPADIPADELLLLDDGHCLRAHALALCGGPASARREEFAGTSLPTLAQMVGAGLGLTLIPALAAEAGLPGLSGTLARRFTPPLVGREIGVAWRSGSVRARDGAALAAALAAFAPKL